jgi:hypothetical protein
MDLSAEANCDPDKERELERQPDCFASGLSTKSVIVRLRRLTAVINDVDLYPLGILRN